MISLAKVWMRIRRQVGHRCSLGIFAILSVFGCLTSATGRELPSDTLIYGVLPTLFDSDRPLNGVTMRLDSLEKLGVTVLWLSPLNTSDDPSHISYAVTDYRGLRNDFGTARDLKAFVDGAHSRGMKVIMDFVANHTSSSHPWFLNSQNLGRKSEFYDFYQRGLDGAPVHYFDWEDLPNLNFNHPRVPDEIFEAMKFWVEEYGIDGFRMDAIWGVKERNPQILRGLTERLVKLKPDILLIAEAGARDEFYFENGFQSAYDWSDSLGEWAWGGEFEKSVPDARRLLRLAMEGSDPNRTLRFLNNNDTGERFITTHGLGRTRAAAVFQFSIPGIPLVYSGDEVGAEFEPYEDCPPLSWEDPNGLQACYQELIRLRKTISPLRSGSMAPVEISGGPGVGAFVRSISETEWALVVVNFGPEDDLILSLPKTIVSSDLWDVMGKRKLVPGADGTLRLRLPKNGSAIILPEALKEGDKASAAPSSR